MKDFISFHGEMMRCCDNSIDLPKNEKYYARGGKILRPEYAQSYSRHYKKLDDCSRMFFRQFFLRGGKEKMFSNFHQLTPSMEFESFRDTVERYARNFLRGKNVNAVFSPASDFETLNQNLCMIFNASVPYAQEFWNEMATRLVNHTVDNIKTREDYAKAFDTVWQMTDDVNALVTDEIRNYQTVEERGELTDTHPYAEQIDQLIGMNRSDAEYCEALEKANRLLTRGEDDAVKYAGDYNEIAAQKYRQIENEEIAERFNDDADYKDAFRYSNGSFAYVGADTPEARVELAKKIAEKDVLIPAAQRDAIKKIIEKIDEYQLFDTDANLYDVNSPKGFAKYIRVRKELTQAVETKDRERIISLSKELEDFEKKADEIIDELKKVDPAFTMASNNAVGRDRNKPFRYRMDVVGASRLNALWSMIAICRQAGVKTDDLIDDPIHTVTKLVEKQMVEDAPISRFGRERDLCETIQKIYMRDPDFNKAYSESTGIGFTLQRTMDGLAEIAGDEAVKLKLAMSQGVIFASQITETMRYVTNGLTSYDQHQNAVEEIANMIAVEQEDRNLLRIMPDAEKIDYVKFEVKKPFDRDEYLKTQTTFEAVKNRMEAVLRDFQDPEKYGRSPVRKAALEAVREVGASLEKIAQTETERAIAATYRKGETTLKKTDVLNYQAEKKFQNLAGVKVTSGKYSEIIKQVADLKKEYDKRGFFAKIFFSSVRRQSRILDGMFDRIAADTEIDRRDLERNVKALNLPDQAGIKMLTEEITERIQDNELAAAQASKDANEKTAQAAGVGNDSPNLSDPVTPETQESFRESIHQMIREENQEKTPAVSNDESVKAIEKNVP